MPALAQRAQRWPSLDEAALRTEVEQLLAATSDPSCRVRVFWKLGPELRYRGFNAQFLADSGLGSPDELLGQTDFHPRIGWSRQAAKYRSDDLAVMAMAEGVKELVERQDQGDETIWLHTAKTSVRLETGAVVGMLGMYEVIDSASAAEIKRRMR